MIRNPYAAGYFYPGTAESINDMLSVFIQKDVPRKNAIGLLVPHAGYQYSGAVAGAAFSTINIPDTAIIIGPSHSGMGKPFSVMASGTWRTPLGDVEIDSGLSQAIISCSSYLEADELAHVQEHAIEVHLPFLQYLHPGIKIVPVILAGAPPAVYREIGRDIARTIQQAGYEVLIVASGDMTHYEPEAVARDKDMKAVEAMLELNENKLAERYKKLHITMCAFGPVMVLMSAARELGVSSSEMVKYATSGDATGDREAVVGYAGVVFLKNNQDPFVKLGRETVEKWVIEQKEMSPPASIPTEMQSRAGVFVSIHKKTGELRGCIGTFEPQQANVAEEIIANAISAATRDPRFPAIRRHELADLDFSVDILTEPEPVTGVEDLNPKRYGVIVASGWRRGLLLPDLEGVDTPEQQISICRQKAGISPDDPVQLYRFEVQRHKEH